MFNLTDAQIDEAADTAALLDSGLIEDCGNGYAVRIPGCDPWFFGDLDTAKRAVQWARRAAMAGRSGTPDEDEDESVVVEGQVTG